MLSLREVRQELELGAEAVVTAGAGGHTIPRLVSPGLLSLLS